MTLMQLYYFREVARVMHFTRAAENLFIAQSSLSYSISELEREIGAPLFVRKNKKTIELTKYGKVMLPHVERMLDELDICKKELNEMLAPNTGDVTVAYSFSNGAPIFADLMNSFYEEPKYANISVHPLVNHVGGTFIEDVLLEGKADLAISTWSLFMENQNVDGTELYQQLQYVVLPKNHPLAGRKSIKLEEIADEPIIMKSGHIGPPEYITKLFATIGKKPKTVEGNTDWSTVILEVARGNGVTIMPKMNVSENRVCFVELDHPENYRTVYLLWRKNRKLAPCVNIVKDYFIKYFNEEYDA